MSAELLSRAEGVGPIDPSWQSAGGGGSLGSSGGKVTASCKARQSAQRQSHLFREQVTAAILHALLLCSLEAARPFGWLSCCNTRGRPVVGQSGKSEYSLEGQQMHSFVRLTSHLGARDSARQQYRMRAICIRPPAIRRWQVATVA